MILTTRAGVEHWMATAPKHGDYYLHFTRLDTDLFFSVWFSFRLSAERPRGYLHPRPGKLRLFAGDDVEGVDWFWSFSRWRGLARNVEELHLFLGAELASS
jgi:hypothetical protein